MKEITIQEAIEYAQNIEMESYRFYKNTATILKEPQTVELAEKLSREEEKHYNQLKVLLQENATPEELSRKVTLDPKDYIDNIVTTSDVAEDASALDILNLALEREKKTEQLYGMLLSLSNLNQTMIRVFEDLRKFEQGHVEMVSEMIDRV
jgi:rubrerythrin